MSNINKLSIIIPVFNEEKTLSEILEKVLSLNLNKEVVIIDDFSTDGTREKIEKISNKNIKIIYQKNNQGKGAAIREGIKAATGDYIVIQDADLEYDPQEIHKLILSVEKGEAEVVYGSRFAGRHKFHSLAHYWGNKFLTLLTNILYGVGLTDMETCYKLVPAKLMKSLKLRANRFDFEPEITAKILKKGYKVKEVPISYEGRSFQSGKKISWKDAGAAIWTLVKYRFCD